MLGIIHKEAGNTTKEARLSQPGAKKPIAASRVIATDMWLKEKLYNGIRGLRAYMLMAAVGASSWMLINSVYGELAALVPALPEGWALPSYIVIAVEASNVCPLVYFIAVTLLVSAEATQKKVDTISTGVVIIVNTLVCVVTAVCWSRHPLLANHSGMLIFCVFASGTVSTLSTICMFAFASRFPDPKYSMTMMIGMVLSGTIPGIIGLIQAPGQPYQHFSVEAYFWWIFAIFVVWCCCFGALVFIRRGDLFSVESKTAPDEGGEKLEEAQCEAPPEQRGEEEKKIEAGGDEKEKRWYNGVWVDLVVVFALNFVENGALTQIVTYAAMPFGSLALEMCTVLSILLAPLACFVPVFVKFKPNGVILCSAVLIPFAYVLAVAKMSPTPFLCGDHDTAGGTLIVFFYIVDKILLSYSKTVIWGRLHEAATACSDNKTASRLTRVTGCCQQGGSFVGALLFFFLVNYTHAFSMF